MLRFYFWVLEGPQLHKKFRAPGPPLLEIWGVKVSTFPSVPQILGGQIPSIFCKGYTRDDLQKPWKFCENLANSFRDIRLFTVRAYRRDTIVSSTLKAESLYSDEYSFTSLSTSHSYQQTITTTCVTGTAPSSNSLDNDVALPWRWSCASSSSCQSLYAGQRSDSSRRTWRRKKRRTNIK